MPRQSRRTFLKRSLAMAGATVTIAGTKSSGKVLGANETVRVGVAGLHGRGKSHVRELAKLPGVEVTYLIDPDTRTFGVPLETLEKVTATKPRTVQDIREALEDQNLDAISIATPNHWHSLMTIWACQAGKDVYVEKPCSHNVHEGRVAVQAARKYRRMVQHGTQSRSSTKRAQVIEAIRSGQLGKLLVARALCYKRRKSIEFKPITRPPAEVNFDLWLGPAPAQPHHGNLVHYNWHWMWDFGNGDIGNQGVHQMDVARWGVGATLPRRVVSLGGRFGYTDQGQTANTQIALFDYGQTQLIFEVRGLETAALHGQKVGNIFHLEAGIIAGTDFFPKGSKEPAPLPDVSAERGPGDGNFGNFIAAVRSRNQSDLNADILEGHYSSALCHLANVSYRLGEQVPFNPKTKAFGDDNELSESLERMEEHLGKENGLKLDEMTCRVGRKLTVNAESETISGDAEANQLLTRNYRKPFLVPEKIS